jgi:hypothetical protein
MVPFGAVRCGRWFDCNNLKTMVLPLNSVRFQMMLKGPKVVYTELVGGSIPSLPTTLILKDLQAQGETFYPAFFRSSSYSPA